MPVNPRSRYPHTALLAIVGLASCDSAGPSNRLVIAPADPAVLAGEALALVAAFEDGTRPSGVIAWSSSDPGTVSVDDGTVTGLAFGSAVISAAAAGQEASTRVTVVELPTSCEQEGTSHAGGVETTTWRAAEGPHGISDSVAVTGTLTLGAGALVCAGDDALIDLRDGARVEAIGTADAPIRFIAADPARPWRGILGVEPADPRQATAHGITLTHARLENATAGVRAAQVTVIESVLRSASRVRILRGGGDSRIERSLLVGTGVQHLQGGLLLQDAVVRDSEGVFVGAAGSVRLIDVRIEGSVGTGLVLYWDRRGPTATLEEVRRLRITGGHSYPAYVPDDAVWALLAAVPPDSLAGNAKDTLVVYGDHLDSLRVRPVLAWKLLDEPWHTGFFVDGDLVVDGDATLRVAVHGPIRVEGRFFAEGSAEHPARVLDSGSEAPWILVGPSGDTSRVAHALFAGIALGGWHAVLISDSEFRDADIGLASAAVSLPSGSRFVRSRILGSTGYGLRIRGSGVLVEECEITASAGAGIHVADTTAGPRIRRCALVGNGGPGVQNEAAIMVAAEHNWWGDPGGPHGPAGDGVSAGVDYDPWLTADPRGG